MHNPYKAKLALLAASFVTAGALSACNSSPTVNPAAAPIAPEPPPEPEIAVNPAPPPTAPEPPPEPEIAVNPAPPPAPVE